MTSEICVMNRLAVVLAADSATTVTHYTSKGREERYFKGANKIFQLSVHAPVGLMIYDSAAIMRVPWELVIKGFRRSLANKTFNTLAEYAAEFFAFIESDPHLFPAEVQSTEFHTASRSAAIKMIAKVTDGVDADIQKAELDAAIAAVASTFEAAGANPRFDTEFMEKQRATFHAPLLQDLQENLKNWGYAPPTDIDLLVRSAINDVLRDPGDYFGTTGLVFAGYGDHAAFPSMIEYQSQGLVLGAHVARMVDDPTVIDHEIPAAVSAFAQTSMADTFQRGLSLDVFMTVMNAVGTGLSGLVVSILEAMKVDAAEVPNLEDKIEAARKAISSTVLETTRQEHALPLRRVLGSLPIEEMAGLAETLIDLQSLKEKVTKPSETVGGPVDVAVITRNEGLVWIKRKHYFDPALNARYTQRLHNES
jgi:hypothetical protein